MKASGTTRKWLFIAAILVAVIAVGKIFLFPDAPMYKGKAVAEWVDLACSGDASQYRKEIAGIGKPAVPFLIVRLRAQDDASRKLRTWAWDHSPEMIQDHFRSPVSASEERENAAQALCLLGTNALPAVPDLIRLVEQPELFTSAAVEALGSTGPGARDSVSALRKALHRRMSLDDVEIALALWNIQGEPGEPLQILLPLITQNADDGAAGNAAMGLALIGPAASTAAPQLRAMINDSRRSAGTRGNAIFALGRIGVTDAELNAQLNNLLADPSLPLRESAAVAILHLDPVHMADALPVVLGAAPKWPGGSKPAFTQLLDITKLKPESLMPALTELLSADSPSLREQAANALAVCRQRVNQP